jgi:hypothetical protein
VGNKEAEKKVKLNNSKVPWSCDRIDGTVSSVLGSRREKPSLVRSGFLSWLLLALVLQAGCAKVQTVSREVYRDDRVQVQLLEQRDPSGNPVGKGFDHPWEVDLQTLDGLLRSIRYQRGILINRKKMRDVFPQAVREDLLVHLQKAFAQAGPDQTVDFSFVYREAWTIFQREYLTDGLLFRKGGKLNCALRNLAFESLGGSEAGGLPCTEDPTEQPLRIDWSFALKDGQRRVASDSSGLFGTKEFRNWIQVDLARDWSAGEASEAQEAQVPEPVEAGPAVQPGPVEPGPPPASPAEIEERLRFLDELHREGSLPDDAYEQKKKELLERRGE